MSQTGSPAGPGLNAASALPVGQVVQILKQTVTSLGPVWVRGELSQIKRRAGGLQYLTLRDTNGDAALNLCCDAYVLELAGPLPEGCSVNAWVRPEVWKTGALMMRCAQLELVGEGQLLAQLEQLKRKLQAEGLFDPYRKKPLPRYPQTIGLITGAKSAAERDVLVNINLRWPLVNVVVRNTLVQGSQAAAEVMAALAELDADPAIELIIIARGGGSVEDLLPFSNEGLVRAVAKAKTPVVSAIGHEPDMPILDLVADLRASTPTDAAKRVVPDLGEEISQLNAAASRLRSSIAHRLSAEANSLGQLISRPVLRDPTGSFDSHLRLTGELRRRLDQAIASKLRLASQEVETVLTKIRSYSPQLTLAKGYAIVADAEGASITSAKQASPGQRLELSFIDGKLPVQVAKEES